jgi:hypothetical protein
MNYLVQCTLQFSVNLQWGRMSLVFMYSPALSLYVDRLRPSPAQLDGALAAAVG